MALPQAINLERFWNLYKGSEDFQAAIGRFKEDSVSSLMKHYNPEYAEFLNAEVVDDITESIYCYGVSESPEPSNLQEALTLLNDIPCCGIWEEGQWVIFPRDYDFILELISEISYAVAKYAPDYFYPYLYSQRITDLISTLNFLDIASPSIPKRSDKEARYEYYWHICEIMGEVRRKYGLTHEETCVFFYDFVPFLMKSEEADFPVPTQCWFIGGIISELNRLCPSTTWQVNKDTRPGDILVHYETSPISAITAVWRAKSDGAIDPFFHWNSIGEIAYKVDVPKITLKELREDSFFSNFPLTRKNFQGVNGFRMGAEAYERLLYLLSQKGFDISVLPKLYAPKIATDIPISVERDVEEKLLIPLLNSLGFEAGRDYKRQMGIHVGTGHRVFPDFVLDFNEATESARIIIEAKLDMATRRDVESAFTQARSYALNLKSDIIILCDKSKLLLFTKHGTDFDKARYQLFGWEELKSPDAFARLKNLLARPTAK